MMADLLRERLIEVLAHTLSAENEEAGLSESPEASTLIDVEPAVTTEELAVAPRDERARVAASVVGALLANTLQAGVQQGPDA
jgi:hypothetical protein